MRKLQGSSERTPIAAGPIAVRGRATIHAGGDTADERGPAATGGGETTQARKAAPKRPRPEPVARKEPEPKEEPAATNPDLGRKTDEPAATDTTDTDERPEPTPAPTRGKFASHYYFGNASSVLTVQSKSKLKATAHWLKANPDKRVVVEGHASTNGNPEANRTLSNVRAEAVKEQLVKLGVDESRVSVEAFGSDRPEFKPGASAKNRRVIIIAK